jgi:Tfp pilus assembly protein PilO
MALGWRKDYLRYRSYFLNIVGVYKQRKDLRMFLELLLTLATVSFFAAFALRPTLLTIIELLKEIDTKEETLTKMSTKIQNLQQAQTLFLQEQSRISLLETTIPDTPAPDAFVRQIEGVAASHPVNLLGVSMGEITLAGEEETKRGSDELEKLPEDAKAISFSLSVSGQYSGIINFLSAIEQMRRPIKIDAINIISSELEGAQNLVLVITGRTPYLKGD